MPTCCSMQVRFVCIYVPGSSNIHRNESIPYINQGYNACLPPPLPGFSPAGQIWLCLCPWSSSSLPGFLSWCCPSASPTMVPPTRALWLCSPCFLGAYCPRDCLIWPTQPQARTLHQRAHAHLGPGSKVSRVSEPVRLLLCS